MNFFDDYDTEDSSSQSQHQDRNQAIKQEMTIYGIQRTKRMDQLFQELWICIFNSILLFSETFDDLKNSIQQIADQLTGDVFKKNSIQIQNQYFYKYKGKAIFQVSYSQDFRKEIEELISHFHGCSMKKEGQTFQTIFQTIFDNLAKCPTLHFIMKQFLIVHKNLLDEYCKAHLQEIQKIGFVKQNSTQIIKNLNKAEWDIMEIQKVHKISIFTEVFNEQQILLKKIQNFIYSKQKFFKLKATYFYRRSFIEIIKKIEGTFLLATQTDLKKRETNMLQLLKFRGQKIQKPVIVMNVLNSQSKYFRECLKQFITYDNIQMLTYQIKGRLKNLIKQLTKKQNLIDYLTSSHQKIYPQQIYLKLYHRAVAISALYYFCTCLNFDVQQIALWRSIQLFDCYLRIYTNITPPDLTPLIIKIFYIVAKNNISFHNPENLDFIKTIANFDIKPTQIDTLEAFLKNKFDFSKIHVINYSFLNKIKLLIQKYSQKEYQQSINLINILIRGVMMDECYFMFDQKVISYTVFLLIQFEYLIINQENQHNDKIDKMLLETMKEQKIDSNSIKKIKECFYYLKQKNFYLLKHCKCANKKYKNVNSLIHHEQLIRLVLSSQSQKRLNF